MILILCDALISTGRDSAAIAQREGGQPFRLVIASIERRIIVVDDVNAYSQTRKQHPFESILTLKKVGCCSLVVQIVVR